MEEDGEETDEKGGEDDVVARGRVYVEFFSLKEEALEGYAAEDVPAELIVAGDRKMVEAMIGFVFISLQHQFI